MPRITYSTVKGVTADGVTDDTDAIQAQLDKTAANGGGMVRLPMGVIRVRAGTSASLGCLRVGDNTHLTGFGRGVTVIKLLDGQDTAHDVTGIVRTPSGVQNAHVTISDLTIDGNKAANSTAGARVIGFYCGVTPNATLADTDIVLRNVEIQNCSAYGFDPHERVTRLVLQGCVAHDNTLDGFTLDACYGAAVVGCISYANGRHGFNSITAAADCTFDGIHGYGNGGSGFVAQNSAKRLSVTGSVFRNNTGDGILLNGVPQAAPQQDITAGAAHTVTGCRANSNGGHGIHLVGISDCMITGNIVRDNSTTTAAAAHGIYLDESGTTYSTGNVVASNRVRSTNGHGFGIAEATANDTGNVLIGNAVVGSATANIRTLGATTVAATNPAL